MARPSQYQSAAAKQAAYRARLASTTTVVDRAALDRLHERLDSLQGVVTEAAQRGDSLARRCRAASIDTMLDKLIAAFRAVAITDCQSKQPPTNRKKHNPTNRE